MGDLVVVRTVRCLLLNLLTSIPPKMLPLGDSEGELDRDNGSGEDVVILLAFKGSRIEGFAFSTSMTHALAMATKTRALDQWSCFYPPLANPLTIAKQMTMFCSLLRLE
jgi:hypothetical protein